MLRRAMVLVLAGVGLAVFSLAQAQEAAPPRERGPGEGRRFDFNQMRERMMSNLKEQTGASDEEWKAMQPKIEKIINIQRDMRTGFGFGRFRPESTDQSQSKLAQAQSDLRKVAEDKNAPADEVTKKLAAYREARDKARDELKTTQKELKGEVKPRQEAVLVLNGILE